MYNEGTKAKKNRIKKGGARMLEPVTKKFEDGSTLEDFKFTFFCDSCGTAVKTVTYPYKPPFKAKFFISKSERRARELIWQSDHASAYDRANKEVLLSFNRCSVCGKRVCDDCFCEEEGICRECASKRKTKEGDDWWNEQENAPNPKTKTMGWYPEKPNQKKSFSTSDKF